MTWLWCRGRSRIRRDYGVAEHRPPTRVLRCRTAQKCYCTAAFLNCITPAGMAGSEPAGIPARLGTRGDRRRRLGVHRRQRSRSPRGHQADWHAGQTHGPSRIRNGALRRGAWPKTICGITRPSPPASSPPRPDRARGVCNALGSRSPEAGGHTNVRNSSRSPHREADLISCRRRGAIFHVA